MNKNRICDKIDYSSLPFMKYKNPRKGDLVIIVNPIKREKQEHYLAIGRFDMWADIKNGTSFVLSRVVEFGREQEEIGDGIYAHFSVKKFRGIYLSAGQYLFVGRKEVVDALDNNKIVRKYLRSIEIADAEHYDYSSSG